MDLTGITYIESTSGFGWQKTTYSVKNQSSALDKTLEKWYNISVSWTEQLTRLLRQANSKETRGQSNQK